MIPGYRSRQCSQVVGSSGAVKIDGQQGQLFPSDRSDNSAATINTTAGCLIAI